MTAEELNWLAFQARQREEARQQRLREEARQRAVSESVYLLQWPAGRKSISIKEAAKLLEPLFPPAPLAGKNDSDLRTEIIRTERQIVSVPEEILAIARSIGAALIHPTLGIVGFTAPDVDWFLNETDLQKIQNKLLSGVNERVAPRPIPKSVLSEHLITIKKQGGPAPAADKMVPGIKAHFSDYHVTRDDVRAVHAEVFGELPPGRRTKQAQ